MEANPRSIHKLFDGQVRYVVPMFQRLYVWGEDPQWRTLWEDLYEKAELRLRGKAVQPHYLGALIVEGVRPVTGREVTRMLVIDRQQRITTLQLLLCAFRDLAKSKNWTALHRKAQRYVENPDADVMEKPEEEIFKLWPTQLNRAIFTAIVNAGSYQAVESAFPSIRRPYQRRPDPRNPLVEGYLYFWRQIEAWTQGPAGSTSGVMEARADALFLALQRDFAVVEISLSQGDDSQEIFYSLNSQGRPLSQSDLLRSLIFMRAEKEQEDRDSLFSDYWSYFETDFWSSEVKRGGRTYTRLDVAMRNFLTVKTGSLIDTRRVSEEYRRWVEAMPAPYSSVRSELTDFTRYARAIEKLEASPGNESSTSMGRILRDLDTSTAIPLVLFLMLEADLSESELTGCFSLVESFLIRRAFCGEETKEYNKLFVEVVGALRGVTGSKTCEILQAKLLSGRGTTRVWPSDDQVIEAALNRPFYGRARVPAIRLILERLELSQRQKKSEDHDLPSGLQIEHVMPQQWTSHWLLGGREVSVLHFNIPSLLESESPELANAIRVRNLLLNTLGNLTLVNRYLNPAASNGPFGLKKTEYMHSVLQLNRYFDQQLNWDEQAIRQRGRMLAERINHIWRHPSTPN